METVENNGDCVSAAGDDLPKSEAVKMDEQKDIARGNGLDSKDVYEETCTKVPEDTRLSLKEAGHMVTVDGKGDEAPVAKDEDEFVIISSTYNDKKFHSRATSERHHRDSRSRDGHAPRREKSRSGDREKSAPRDQHRGRSRSRKSHSKQRETLKEESETRHKKPDEPAGLLDVVTTTVDEESQTAKCFPNGKYNRRDGRNRTMFLGPIERSTLCEDNMDEMIKKATTLSATWKVSSRTSKMEGNMALHFMTTDDECAVRSKVKERNVKMSNDERVCLRTQSRHGVNVDSLTAEWERASFPCKPNSGEVTSMFVNKLPPATQRYSLHQLFPDACGAVLPLKEDGTAEGWVMTLSRE